MRIVVYSVMHNESALLPFFMAHYQQIADEIIIYDHNSTDDTAALACSLGAKVNKYYDIDDYLDERKFAIFPDVVINRRQEGFAIWVDADEFIYAADLRGYLETCQHNFITWPKVAGYTMIADELPPGGVLIDQCPLGIPDSMYSKQVVFDTQCLPMCFSDGKHRAKPRGVVFRDAVPKIKLLHYAYFGDDYFLARRQKQIERHEKPMQEPHPGAKYSLAWFEAQREFLQDVRNA